MRVLPQSLPQWCFPGFRISYRADKHPVWLSWNAGFRQIRLCYAAKPVGSMVKRRSKVYKANSRSYFGISNPTKIYSRKIGENRGSLGGCLWRNCLPDYISSLRADAD